MKRGRLTTRAALPVALYVGAGGFVRRRVVESLVMAFRWSSWKRLVASLHRQHTHTDRQTDTQTALLICIIDWIAAPRTSGRRRVAIKSLLLLLLRRQFLFPRGRFNRSNYDLPVPSVRLNPLSHFTAVAELA